MAGKTNTSATYFAQKKLLGKAHTSNLKTDGEELIGSNIQSATSLIFGEAIPDSPEQTLYLLQSASNGGPATVEYIQFNLDVLTGTTYDANNTSPDGGAGSDTGEDTQVSGPHAYKFKFPSDYESSTSNSRANNGYFDNNKLVHETLGTVQLIPPFFSQTAPNPYIIKIYKDDGGGGVGDEIPLLDNIDWNVDYYNGILFLQDYKADKIPAFARAFAYVGKMAQEVISSGSSSGGSGGGSGDNAAEYVLTTATGSLPNAKVIEAGSGITLTTGASTITISSDISAVNGREKSTYFVTSSHPALTSLDIAGPDFSNVQYDTNKIDINLNGQLLHTGSSSQVIAGERDYYLSSTGSIVFGFDLENNDVIDAIINVVGGGGSGGGGDSTASFLVLSNTGSLSNERAFVAGTGLIGTDAGANNDYTLSIDNSVVATLTGSLFSGVVSAPALTGSLTKLQDGSSYLVAGENINILSGSSGQITISTSGTRRSRSKNSYEVSSLILSGTAFSTAGANYANAGYLPDLIDVHLNGQLLLSGTDSQVGSGNKDYFVYDNSNLKFGFDLVSDDIVSVSVISFDSTIDAYITDQNASYLVITNTGSLLNERSISVGSGLTATDNGSGNSYEITNNNGNYVFNEYIGEADGSNTRFTLDYAPTANKNVSVFVNGQLQMPATDITGAPFQDYSVTGSVIFFTTSSLPDLGSILMANYTTNQSIS